MRRAFVLRKLARAVVFLSLLSAGAEMAFADFPPIEKLPANPALPDPLVRLDGSRVTTPEEWREKRRDELKSLFQHYMYGIMPPQPAKSTGNGVQDPGCLGGKATRIEYTIESGPAGSPKFHVLMFIPNNRKPPSPVFVGLNFHGNHTVLDDPKIALPDVWMPASAGTVQDNKATDAGRGKDASVWSVAKVIDHGYALATVYCGDFAPDHPGYTDGIFPPYARPGTPRAADDFGAVAAWAWGISRVIDILESESDRVDLARIAVVGHSRLGKAALLAGAFDDRIDLVIGHQAGCGGSAPSRGKVGESVKQINDRFPHWFADTFKAFNDQTEKLPFDQNGLFALVAPRPLLLTNGDLDTWANPVGQFEALKAADGVYRLLEVNGIDDQPMPPVGKLVGDRLAYHLRAGKHAMLPEDWDVFLAFADKHFQNK